jgi:hypothetical protein
LRKLAAAARLSGPDRYLTYGKLDLDLARNAAPIGGVRKPRQQRLLLRSHRLPTCNADFGMELAAVCLRRAGAG